MEPAPDASPADWLVAALTTFPVSVTTLVPPGFEAYARVFHPAERPWAEVAAANGKVAHPAMQWLHIAGVDGRPAEGHLDGGELAARLRRHTTTPDRCWFAIWHGYGDEADWVPTGPAFALPERGYHLFGGPIEDVTTSFCTHRAQSANLWWPDDRAWCVATEIDLDSTYVGASAAAVADLLDLEATPIDPTTGISWASDTVNAP